MQRFDEFKGECTKRGILRVETYSSNGLYPVGNSRVIVYKEIDGEKYYIYDSHTDSSGILDNLQLPAPDKSLSETEQGSCGLAPYATYDIFVSHPGFISTYLETFRSSTPPFQYSRSKCCRRSAASRIRT